MRYALLDWLFENNVHMRHYLSILSPMEEVPLDAPSEEKEAAAAKILEQLKAMPPEELAKLQRKLKTTE